MTGGKKQKKKTASAPVPVAPVGRPLRERHRLFLALTLGFCALVGGLCVLQFRNSPFFNFPIIDEAAYVKWGREIAAGDVFGSKIFYQDPLYPYFLGLVFRLFGENFMLVRLLQAAMGVGSAALVYWTGRKLRGPWLGVAAAAVFSLYRGVYFLQLQIEKTSLVVLFSAASCALGVAAADKPRSWWRWGALGFSLGLLTLLRGNFQPILPIMLLWAFFAFRESRLAARFARAALFAAGALVILAPVMVRNHAVGGEWVLTTSQGGANFYIGNNELATGRYCTLPFVRANPIWEAMDFRTEAEKRTGRKLSSHGVSSFWFREAFKWISAHPIEAFGLTLYKARLLVHQYEIPDNHSLYLTRKEFVPALWLAALGFGVLWGPALLGALWLPRRDRRAQYPALFGLLYGLSIIPFFIVDRYRMAMVPVIALFFAAAVFLVAEKWREQQWKVVAAAGGWLVVALLIGFLPTLDSQSPMGIEYYLLGDAYLNTGKPAEAIRSFDKSLRINPDNIDAINGRMIAMRQVKGGGIEPLLQKIQNPATTPQELMGIGKQLEDFGNIPAALSAYEAAIARQPDFFPARVQAGHLYSDNPEVKNYAKAIENLTVAVKINPDSLDAMDALAYTYFLAGNTTDARKTLELVLAKDPNNQAALQNLEILRQQEEQKP